MLSFLTSPKTLVVVFALFAGATSFYLWTLYQKSQADLNRFKSNPQTVSIEEGKMLVNKVGLLIALPKEEPTIATVTDVGKLKDQPFFSQAVNGDKVLIYTQAKKAILYRPGINKIIDVAPVNVGVSPSPQVGPSANITPTRIPTPTATLTPTLIPLTTVSPTP